MNYNLQKLSEVNPELCQQLRGYCYDINGCCQTVHRELGPFLNEYVYQDALEVVLREQNVPYQKEYYFSVMFHGQRLDHKHYVDFYLRDRVFLECKAIDNLGSEQRQQLWNYMRLAKVPVGILVNFAPVKDQSEHYFLDLSTGVMYLF